jgi:hypothetical protein
MSMPMIVWLFFYTTTALGRAITMPAGSRRPPERPTTKERDEVQLEEPARPYSTLLSSFLEEEAAHLGDGLLG